jgi:hypothetical protein
MVNFLNRIKHWNSYREFFLKSFLSGDLEKFVTLKRYIGDYAYVPEHLPHYVTAISQTEPFLMDDFLVYVKKEHLVFVGFPLKENLNEGQMNRGLEHAIKRFKPKEVSLIAASIPSSVNGCPHSPLIITIG